MTLKKLSCLTLLLLFGSSVAAQTHPRRGVVLQAGLKRHATSGLQPVCLLRLRFLTVRPRNPVCTAIPASSTTRSLGDIRQECDSTASGWSMSLEQSTCRDVGDNMDTGTGFSPWPSEPQRTLL